MLERRPDIAANERRVAEANEQVGLAHTAFFPQILLGAALGLSVGAALARTTAWQTAFLTVGAPGLVLALMANQQRQIDLLIEIAHVGDRDVYLGSQLGVNLTVGGAGLLAPPANAHQYIITIGGARKRDALSFC